MSLEQSAKPLLILTAFLGSAVACAAPPAPAPDQTVAIYAAGSLREVVSQLATEAGAALGVEIKSSFGGSGAMRERIEHGEPADLLMSADVGSPRKLVMAHHTVVPAVPFARNRVCIVSQPALAITADNMADRLPMPDIRLRTSRPVADPGGDYAWAILDSIDVARPGSGAILKQKAQENMDLEVQPTVPGQSAAAALVASGKVNVIITYCSAVPSLLKELPQLTSFAVPARFDPHPLYGIAVLSDRPAVLRVALFVLSEQGQEIIRRSGLVPLSAAQSTGAP